MEAEKLTKHLDDVTFDDVLSSVGDAGPFQMRYNILYNLVFVVFAAMPYFNIVLAMSIPEHWCLVPGRELTNYTQKEWRSLTIPMLVGTRFTCIILRYLIYLSVIVIFMNFYCRYDHDIIITFLDPIITTFCGIRQTKLVVS